MIVDERMVTYINSLDMGNTPLLNEIEKEAKADLVPVIRREMQSFLKVLLAIHRPLRVLEVGTAVGFSAIMRAAWAILSSGSHVTSAARSSVHSRVAS